MDKIDLGRAFKAPFTDADWIKKTLMGWLWMLLGVTAPAVYGAQLEYIKSVSEGREDLPDWSDFGGKWVKGLMLLIAGFIYTLPIWILFFVLAVPGIIAAVASDGNSGAGLFGGGMCLFTLFAVGYGIAVAVLFYAATVNYALKGDFGAFFQFSEILARVKDGSGYWAAFVWAIVVSMALSLAVSILSATFIGYILVPAVTYLSVMITAHLFGQWATRSYGIQAAALPVAAPGYVPPAGTYPPPPAPTPPAYSPPAAPVPAAAPAPPAAPAAPPAPYEPPAAAPAPYEPPAAAPAPYEPPAAPAASPVAPPAAPAAPPVAAPEAPAAPPAPYEPPTAPPAPPAGPEEPTS